MIANSLYSYRSYLYFPLFYFSVHASLYHETEGGAYVDNGYYSSSSIKFLFGRDIDPYSNFGGFSEFICKNLFNPFIDPNFSVFRKVCHDTFTSKDYPNRNYSKNFYYDKVHGEDVGHYNPFSKNILKKTFSPVFSSFNESSLCSILEKVLAFGLFQDISYNCFYYIVSSSKVITECKKLEISFSEFFSCIQTCLNIYESLLIKLDNSIVSLVDAKEHPLFGDYEIYFFSFFRITVPTFFAKYNESQMYKHFYSFSNFEI